MQIALVAACGLILTANAQSLRAASVTYGGVTFPQGDISFADAVVSFTVGSGPGFVTPTPPFIDPANALGPPNFDGSNAGSAFVSMGYKGVLVLKFTDNVLTGSGDSSQDLWIFEVGTGIEGQIVDVSKDGQTWTNVGQTGGATSGIDLDAFGFGVSDHFSYVRLTDTGNNFYGGTTAGPDIDAVGAISTLPASAVPLPAAMWSGLSVLGAMGVKVARRRQR
jgi:hypothetical protein